MGVAADLVGAVLVRDSRILLGRRSPTKSSAPSCWDVIGGQVEPGETFEEACVREIAEEIAVHAELDDELLRTRLPSGGEYRIFRVTRWSGDSILANDEHSELGWFSPDEACRLRSLAATEYVTLFAKIAAGPIA